MAAEERSSTPDIKRCCRDLYENDLLSLLMQDVLHPGGEDLTIALGKKLQLKPDTRLLDIACGAGVSAVLIAAEFGSRVTGTDISEKNLSKARARAEASRFAGLIEFLPGDAHDLNLPASSFDAVISECSFCTFEDRSAAAGAAFRVLRRGGRIGLSDVTIDGELPADLDKLIMKAACVASAMSPAAYCDLLEEAGFVGVEYEDHSYALAALVDKFAALIEGWGAIEKLCGCNIEELVGATKDSVKSWLDRAYSEVESGRFGYAVFVGTKGGGRDGL